MRVAYREWRIRWDPTTGPVLQSTLMSTLWTETDLAADRAPEDDTNTRRLGAHTEPLHGVHACLPWCKTFFLARPDMDMISLKLFAVGAVDLQDKVVEHADGVVRAERVTILALRLVDVVRWYDLSYPGGRNETIFGAPCGHTEYHVVSGIYRDFWALRRKCASVSPGLAPKLSYGCDGYDKVKMFEAPYNVPHEVKATVQVAEIEGRLRQRYEVPRLPDDDGPWMPPWGRGPRLQHLEEESD